MPMPLLWIVTTCVLLACATVARAGEEPLTGTDLLRCAQRAEFSHAQRQVAMRAFESYLTDVRAALAEAEASQPDRLEYQDAAPRVSVAFSRRYVAYRRQRQRVLDEHAALLWDQLRGIATPTQLIWIDLCAAAARADHDLRFLNGSGLGASNLERRLLETSLDRATALAVAHALRPTAAERSRLCAELPHLHRQEHVAAQERVLDRMPDIAWTAFNTQWSIERNVGPSLVLPRATRLDRLTLSAFCHARAAFPEPDASIPFWHAVTTDLTRRRSGKVLVGLNRLLARAEPLDDADRRTLLELRAALVTRTDAYLDLLADQPRSRHDFYANDQFAEARVAIDDGIDAVWTEASRVTGGKAWLDEVRGPEEAPHLGMPPYLAPTVDRVTPPLHDLAGQLATAHPALADALAAYRAAIDHAFTPLLADDPTFAEADARALLEPAEAALRRAVNDLDAATRARVTLLLVAVERQGAGAQRQLSPYARMPLFAAAPVLDLDDDASVERLIDLERALTAQLRRSDVPEVIDEGHNAVVCAMLDTWIDAHAEACAMTPDTVRRAIAETHQSGRLARFDVWRAELTTVINDAAAIDDPFTTLLLDARTRFDAAVEIVLHLERHSAVWIVGRGGAPQPGVGWGGIDRYERAVVEIEGVRALAELWRPAPAS